MWVTDKQGDHIDPEKHEDGPRRQPPHLDGEQREVHHRESDSKPERDRPRRSTEP